MSRNGYNVDLSIPEDPKITGNVKAEWIEEGEGYGNCPDCGWYKRPEGCNVPRSSHSCLKNRCERKTSGKEYGLYNTQKELIAIFDSYKQALCHAEEYGIKKYKIKERSVKC